MIRQRLTGPMATHLTSAPLARFRQLRPTTLKSTSLLGLLAILVTLLVPDVNAYTDAAKALAVPAVCGSNTYGTIPVPDAKVRVPFDYLAFDDLKGAIQITSGLKFVIFLMPSGKVYGLGKNTRHSLALSSQITYSATPVEIPFPSGVFIVDVFCETQCMALSSDGVVYGWGNNADRVLLIPADPVQTPTVVPTPEGVRVDGISCTARTCAMWLEDGRVLTSGQNNLMMGLPWEVVSTMSDLEYGTLPASDFAGKVVGVAFGDYGAYAWTETGRAYAWGWHDRQDYFALGIDTEEEVLYPTLMVALQHEVIVQITSCYSYAVALTAEGEVYVWGRSWFGIGLGEESYARLPTKIPGLSGVARLSRSHGLGKHVILVSHNGEVSGIGWNGLGQLCTGNEDNQRSPYSPETLTKVGVSRVWVDYGASYFAKSACDQDGDFPPAPVVTESIVQCASSGSRTKVCQLEHREFADEVNECGCVDAEGIWPNTGPNQTVTRDCPAGFSGSITRSCSAVGAWDAEVANCVALECSAADGFPLTVAGKIAALECPEGMTGERTRECDILGQWGDAVDTCNLIKCPKINQSGVTWPESPGGITVDARCPIETIGKMTRECNALGSWENVDQSRCTRVNYSAMLERITPASFAAGILVKLEMMWTVQTDKATLFGILGPIKFAFAAPGKCEIARVSEQSITMDQATVLLGNILKITMRNVLAPPAGGYVVCLLVSTVWHTQEDPVTVVPKPTATTISVVEPNTFGSGGTVAIDFRGAHPSALTAVTLATDANSCSSPSNIVIPLLDSSISTEQTRNLDAGQYVVCLTGDQGESWVVQSGLKVTVVGAPATTSLAKVQPPAVTASGGGTVEFVGVTPSATTAVSFVNVGDSCAEASKRVATTPLRTSTSTALAFPSFSSYEVCVTHDLRTWVKQSSQVLLVTDRCTGGALTGLYDVMDDGVTDTVPTDDCTWTINPGDETTPTLKQVAFDGSIDFGATPCVSASVNITALDSSGGVLSSMELCGETNAPSANFNTTMTGSTFKVRYVATVAGMKGFTLKYIALPSVSAITSLDAVGDNATITSVPAESNAPGIRLSGKHFVPDRTYCLVLKRGATDWTCNAGSSGDFPDTVGITPLTVSADGSGSCVLPQEEMQDVQLTVAVSTGDISSMQIAQPAPAPSPAPGQISSSVALDACLRDGFFWAATIPFRYRGCPPGQASTSPTARCEDCPQGTHSTSEGSLKCTPCPPGRASNIRGVAQCTPCAAGSYQRLNITGDDELFRLQSCTLCPIGTFQPSPGQPTCLSCRTGDPVPVDSGLSVTTIADFPLTSQSEITKDPGATSVGECVCVHNHYETRPNDQSVICTQCPLDPAKANCPGGGEAAYPNRGFYRFGQERNPFNFMTCRHEEACQGGKGEQCSSAYTGILCATCRRGYYSLGEFCLKCPAATSGWEMWMVLGIAVGVSLLIYILPARGVSGDLGLATISMSITHIQMVNLLAGFRVKWPPFLLDMLRYLAFVNFDFDLVRPECRFPDITYTERWVYVVNLPFYCVALFMFFTVVACLKVRIRQWREGSTQTAKSLGSSGSEDALGDIEGEGFGGRRRRGSIESLRRRPSDPMIGSPHSSAQQRQHYRLKSMLSASTLMSDDYAESYGEGYDSEIHQHQHRGDGDGDGGDSESGVMSFNDNDSHALHSPPVGGAMRRNGSGNTLHKRLQKQDSALGRLRIISRQASFDTRASSNVSVFRQESHASTAGKPTAQSKVKRALFLLTCGGCFGLAALWREAKLTIEAFFIQTRKPMTYSMAMRSGINGCVVALSITYVVIAKKTFEGLDCVTEADGRRFLDAQPNILCSVDDDEDFAFLQPRALLMTFLLVMGIPLLFAVLLFTQVDMLAAESRKQMLGYLYGRFKLNVFWWELMILLRKLLLVLATVFFTRFPWFQVAAGMAVLFVSIIIHIWYQPYYSKLVNAVDFLLMVNNFMVMFSGLLFFNMKEDSLQYEVFAWLVVLIIVSGIVGALIAVGVEVRLKISDFMLDNDLIFEQEDLVREKIQTLVNVGGVELIYFMENQLGEHLYPFFLDKIVSSHDIPSTLTRNHLRILLGNEVLDLAYYQSRRRTELRRLDAKLLDSAISRASVMRKFEVTYLRLFRAASLRYYHDNREALMRRHSSVDKDDLTMLNGITSPRLAKKKVNKRQSMRRRMTRTMTTPLPKIESFWWKTAVHNKNLRDDAHPDEQKHSFSLNDFEMMGDRLKHETEELARMGYFSESSDDSSVCDYTDEDRYHDFDSEDSKSSSGGASDSERTDRKVRIISPCRQDFVSVGTESIGLSEAETRDTNEQSSPPRVTRRRSVPDVSP
eukprot:GFYU01008258.1.p1 GENE.GFYU01008258.1~~GFYU01008258.1.p1  ORF type:complete len:2339 (-),score=326.96 GFYU01008258.1:72-7088(-)